MGHTKYLLILIFLIISSVVLAEEIDDAGIVVELCMDRNTNDEGFIYSKALLAKYGDDKGAQLALKELRTFCLVSDKFIKEAFENANEVIKTSSNPLFIGCAWLQKSRYAMSNNEDQEALSNSAIALKVLEKIPDTEEEWIVGQRDWFKFVCHVEKNSAYKNLEKKEKAEEEQVFIDAFINSLNKKSNLSN